MNHWRAIRRIACLLDGTMSAREEAQVRAHLAACGRCQQEWEDVLLADSLVRRLPASIAPLAAGPESYRRLVGLGRWTAAEGPRPRGRFQIPAVGIASLAAVLVLTFAVSEWQPLLPGIAPLELSLVSHEVAALPVWRPGR
jgi:anti-sigma factor RsiW